MRRTLSEISWTAANLGAHDPHMVVGARCHEEGDTLPSLMHNTLTCTRGGDGADIYHAIPHHGAMAHLLRECRIPHGQEWATPSRTVLAMAKDASGWTCVVTDDGALFLERAYSYNSQSLIDVTAANPLVSVIPFPFWDACGV